MTEKVIHQQFNAFLRERGIPFIEARMDRAPTIAKSWPDYTILWMGRVICIEVKTEKGRVSPAQNLKIDFIRQSGCRVEICRSLQECVEAAKGILCHGGDKRDAAGICGTDLCHCGGDWIAFPLYDRCQTCATVRYRNHVGKPWPTTQNPAEGQKESPSEPAPDSMSPAFTAASNNTNLFIASVFGTDWVMAGESFAGGMASMVRRPTPQDIRELPRK